MFLLELLFPEERSKETKVWEIWRRPDRKGNTD